MELIYKFINNNIATEKFSFRVIFFSIVVFYFIFVISGQENLFFSQKVQIFNFSIQMGVFVHACWMLSLVCIIYPLAWTGIVVGVVHILLVESNPYLYWGWGRAGSIFFIHYIVIYISKKLNWISGITINRHIIASIPSLIYFSCNLFRFKYDHWVYGSTLLDALIDARFSRFPLFFTNFENYFRIPFQYLTYMGWITEILGILLIFTIKKSIRKFIIGGLLILHLFIFLFLKVQVWSLFISGLLLYSYFFTPPEKGNSAFKTYYFYITIMLIGISLIRVNTEFPDSKYSYLLSKLSNTAYLKNVNSFTMFKEAPNRYAACFYILDRDNKIVFSVDQETCSANANEPLVSNYLSDFFEKTFIFVNNMKQREVQTNMKMVAPFCTMLGDNRTDKFVLLAYSIEKTKNSFKYPYDASAVIDCSNYSIEKAYVGRSAAVDKISAPYFTKKLNQINSRQ